MDPKFGTVTIENHLPVPITNSELMETAPDIKIFRTEQINPGQREIIEIPEVAGRLRIILSDGRTHLTNNDFSGSSGIWSGQILSASGVPETLSCRFERSSEKFKQSAASTTPDVCGEVVSYPHEIQSSQGLLTSYPLYGLF